MLTIRGKSHHHPLDAIQRHGAIIQVAGNQVAFKPVSVTPEAFTIIYPFCLFSPPFQPHPSIPIRTLHISHPIRCLSQLAGHQQGGNLAGDCSAGPQPHASSSCPPRGALVAARSEEHSMLAPRCLLYRNSSVCQQLQLGITPPDICFLAQESKSVFRSSKSVRLLF